jgi:hypothetical protein
MLQVQLTGTFDEFRVLFAQASDNAVSLKLDAVFQSLATVGIILEGFRMDQAQLAQELRNVSGQVAKIRTETAATLQKVIDLQGTIGTVGTVVTQEVIDALTALKVQAQLTDDLVPDVSAPPPIVI